MTNLETRTGKELPRRGEMLNPAYDVIELAGWAGTGKSTTGRVLASLHGADFACIGDIFRVIKKKTDGQRVSGTFERPMWLDNLVDRLGNIILENLHTRKPFIVDSRLGPIHARLAEKKAQDEGRTFPRVVNILLTASDEVAARRVSQRDGISIEQALQNNKERNEKDREVYNSFLPEDLKEMNLLDGAQHSLFGKPLFDFILPTDNLTKEGNIVAINTWLRENGYLTLP